MEADVPDVRTSGSKANMFFFLPEAATHQSVAVMLCTRARVVAHRASPRAPREAPRSGRALCERLRRTRVRGDRLPSVQALTNASAATSVQGPLMAPRCSRSPVIDCDCTLVAAECCSPARLHSVGMRFMGDSAGPECVATASPPYKHPQTHLRQPPCRALDGSAEDGGGRVVSERTWLCACRG